MRMSQIALGLVVFLAGVRSPKPKPGEHAVMQDESCQLSEEDTLWITESVAAWRYAALEILKVEDPPSPIAIFFDASCVWSTEELYLDGRAPRWNVSPHAGTIHLPSGETMPPVITSFAAPHGDNGAFFVMSTPSVWRAGGVKSEIDLGTFMVAVLLHEISHTSQVGTYMSRVTMLEKAGDFGEDLSDDVLQETFGADTGFASSVKRETDLLFRAATVADEAQAQSLAREARDSIVARRDSYRDQRELHELEDLFLTLEGSAQWVATTWLTSADGGAVDLEVALRDFGRRTGYWSQVQGLALFLVIDRFVDDWESAVYAEGRVTALQLLEQALD